PKAPLIANISFLKTNASSPAQLWVLQLDLPPPSRFILLAMADSNTPGRDAPPAPTEHLNIKVTDNNNEVFFKIKRTTQLKKLMDAFCERQGKQPQTVRFLFDGTRVRPEDSPETVSVPLAFTLNECTHRPL